MTDRKDQKEWTSLGVRKTTLNEFNNLNIFKNSDTFIQELLKLYKESRRE